MDAEHEDRLVDELARLLDGAAGPDDDASMSAVADAPREGELADMLVLASSLRGIEPPPPRAEFRAELRDRLLREAAESSLTPAETPATPSWVERLRVRLAEVWHSGAVATASIVGAVAVLGVGIVAVSEHAQPGDLLYGVKQASEQVRLTLATDEAERGQLHLRLAERRLEEVSTGARSEPNSELIDGLARMDRHTTIGGSILLDIYHDQGETAAARDLRAFTERQRERLEATLPELPVTVIPFAEDSLDLLDRIDAELDGLVLHGCVPCAEVPGGPVGDDGTGRCCPNGGDAPAADVSTPTRDVDREAETETDDTTTPLPDAFDDDERDPLVDLPASPPSTSVTDDVSDLIDDLPDPLNDLLDDAADGTEDLREDLGGLLGD